MSAMILHNLLPGDCIGTRSNTLLSKGIRFFQTEKGKSRISHIALALGDFRGAPKIIESLDRVRVKDALKYMDQSFVVWRIPDEIIEKANPGFSASDVRSMVASFALDFAGDGYAWLKIPLFALDGIFRTYRFTQTFGISNWKVCSNFYAYCWIKAGNINFGRNWRSISPDYLDDWFMNVCVNPVYDGLKGG